MAPQISRRFLLRWSDRIPTSRSQAGGAITAIGVAHMRHWAAPALRMQIGQASALSKSCHTAEGRLELEGREAAPANVRHPAALRSDH